MTKPRILAFCRPYLVPDFRAMFAPLQGDFEVHHLTDGRRTGVPDTQDRFYAAYRARQRSAELPGDRLDDIVTRCRLLRHLPREEAERRAQAIAVTLGEALDEVRPQAIFAHMVDEYILATLSHLAQVRRIPFVTYFESFFPGFVNISTFQHGSPVMLREPGPEEVAAALERVSPREFRVDYNQRLNFSVASHVRAVARHYLRRAYLGAKRRIERDPLNMHYQITPYVADKTRLRDYPRRSDFAPDWAARLADLRAARPGQPVVYAPLAYYPEASTDYWVRNRRMLGFERATLEILDALAGDAIVLVKEHPHMLGIRDRGFLAELGRRAHVISIFAGEYSNAVLEAADLVLLGSGSAGIEATIRGKPVLGYSDTCYWFGGSGAHVLDLDRLEALPAQVREIAAAGAPPVDAEALVRHCLASTLRKGEGGRRWPIVNAEDLAGLLARAAAGALPGTAGAPAETACQAGA